MVPKKLRFNTNLNTIRTPVKKDLMIRGRFRSPPFFHRTENLSLEIQAAKQSQSIL